MDDALAGRLLLASPDALWLIGLDGSTLYGNDRLEALLGRDPAGLTSDNVFDVTDDQGRLDLARHFEAMRAGHPGGQNDEVFIVRPDGTRVWTLVSWTPYLDESGTVVGYLHRLTEHTERRELLDRLSERETELESAQSIAHLGSWTWDLVTGHISWSNELYRIYGASEGDVALSYEWVFERTHPDERAWVQDMVACAVCDGTDFSYEGRILTAQDEMRWVRAGGRVEVDDEGVPLRLNGTCQDITDLRLAALDAAEARRRLGLLSSIAEAANRSDTLDDALGRAQHALHDFDEWAARTVWGRATGDGAPILLHDVSADGRPAPGPHHVAALDAWRNGELISETGHSPGTTRVWLPLLLDGRTAFLIELEGSVAQLDDPVRDLLEQVAMTLARGAEREQAAVQLASARDEAMAASAHKSAFLATMSHEIRTPMNGVIGLNDLLLRTDLDGHQRRLAEGLRGAGSTLLALLTDILDLSKIEAGAVELEHAPFEIAPLLDQVATIISPPAQEKRLELVLSCDPAVPATLLGDRVRLGQVLTNLASNAVKFTDQGEVVVEFSLDPQSRPERLLLRGEVRDTGIGIGSDAAALFEAFTQADRSTTRRHGGTGLGLAISRRLVRDMGGSIGADERAGGGSTFWFVVPVEPAPDADQTPALSALAPREVLVVDDNATSAATLRSQLTDWGLTVTVVASGDAALHVLRERTGTPSAFDLVLVDLYMPDVDGLTLGRSLTSTRDLEELSVILLSDDPSVTLDQARAAGFCCIVDKPVRATELHDAVLVASRCADDAPVPEGPARGSARTYVQLDLNVLVVEDNLVNQLVAQGLLEGLGCRSTIAANGEEAVTALAPGHAYDLVRMDCRMPRMDGYDATEVIRSREEGARVPIVAMTASALAGERERCLGVGMDDFLSKPVDPNDLARVVGFWATTVATTGATTAATTGATASRARPEQAETPWPLAHQDPGPDLDPERVEMLRELVRDGVSFFERTRTSFLARVEETLAALRSSRDDDDLVAMAAVAHQLKGSALNLGLTRVGLRAATSRRQRSSATSRVQQKPSPCSR
uniref:response regulator n=1 Tax=Nocardioides sp. TaxID=35761 RepID=UPI002B272F66